MLSREFFSPHSGRCVFTLECPDTFVADKQCKPHYTYSLSFKEGTINPTTGKKWQDAYFVSLLSGPDNENDYTYLGMMNHATGEVFTTKASKLPADSWPIRLVSLALQRIFASQGEKIEKAGFRIHHEGRCGRCGKTLTVPESVETGLGPECRKLVKG